MAVKFPSGPLPGMSKYMAHMGIRHSMDAGALQIPADSPAKNNKNIIPTSVVYRYSYRYLQIITGNL